MLTKDLKFDPSYYFKTSNLPMPLWNDFAGIKSWMGYISNSILGTLRTDNAATK